jgi:hypothetical protein
MTTRSTREVDDGLYVYVAVQVDVWDKVNVKLNGYDPGAMPLIDRS